MSHSESRSYWAVVCTKLHKAYGPAASRADAERFCEQLNKNSLDHAAEQDNDPCTYRVIPIIVQQVVKDEPVGTVVYDRDAEKKKKRLMN